MKIIIFLFILAFSHCKEAVFNHPAEGLPGYIFGIASKNIANTILVSNSSDTIEEGQELKIGIKLSQGITAKISITIESSNPAISVNGSSKETVEFNSENSSIDQFVTLKAVEDSNRIGEGAELSFTSASPSVKSTKLNISVNDTIGYNIILSGATNITEESTATLTVSLGLKPETNVRVALSSNDSSSVTISNNLLSFTPENYSTPQTVSYKINDTYNALKNYTFTASIETENKKFVVSVTDNDYQYKDISAGQPSDSAYNPSIAIDSLNNKIYVSARNIGNSSKLSIYKCDIDGSNCAHKDASSGQGANSAFFPKIALSGASGASSNLRIVTSNRSTGNIDLSIFSCGTDFVSCSHNSIAGATNIGYDPKILINSENSKLYIFGVNATNLFYLICNLDGTNCSLNDMGIYGHIGAGYQSRGIELELSSGKIYSVNTGGKDEKSFYIPVFKKFDTAATNLQSEYISLVPRIGYGPDLKLDKTNSKLLIASSNWSLEGRPWLFNCDLNGQNCVTKDIASSKPFPTYYPSLNIDTINNKLLIVAVDNNTYKLNLFHCDTTGDNCKATEISLGKLVPIESYQYHFDSTIDYANKRLIIVFTDKDTGKLSLIRLGLGGFP